MSNTIAGANLAEIAQESLPNLKSTFAPLAALTTDFSSDISSRGASVTTRFPVNPTAIDLSSGYTVNDVSMTAKTITLNTFFGFVYGFTDVERSKSSIMLNELFIQPALQALGNKVFGDLWNLVTAANFAQTALNTTAGDFDRSDLADLSATLTGDLKAPKQGRSVVLNPTYYASLVKSLNSAEIPGITADKAEGVVPRVAGFDVYQTDLADANSEYLQGFAFQKASLLMAGRSVDSTGAAAAGVEVADVVIPDLGLPVQFRKWYDPDLGVLKYSCGILYGMSVGQNFGVRIIND
jgi:hypothetical protein